MPCPSLYPPPLSHPVSIPWVPTSWLSPSPPVDELSADAALEEATAAIAGIDAVVLPTAGVPAHLAQQYGAQCLARGWAQSCRSGAKTLRVSRDTQVSLIPLHQSPHSDDGALPLPWVQPRGPQISQRTWMRSPRSAHRAQHQPTPQGCHGMSSHGTFKWD